MKIGIFDQGWKSWLRCISQHHFLGHRIRDARSRSIKRWRDMNTDTDTKKEEGRGREGGSYSTGAHRTRQDGVWTRVNRKMKGKEKKVSDAGRDIHIHIETKQVTETVKTDRTFFGGRRKRLILLRSVDADTCSPRKQTVLCVNKRGLKLTSKDRVHVVWQKSKPHELREKMCGCTYMCQVYKFRRLVSDCCVWILSGNILCESCVRTLWML